MADQAWATAVIEENYQAIISECAGNFDMTFLKAWVETNNGEAYFIRDKVSPLDCLLFPADEFHRLYTFKHSDVEALFRLVLPR